MRVYMGPFSWFWGLLQVLGSGTCVSLSPVKEAKEIEAGIENPHELIIEKGGNNQRNTWRTKMFRGPSYSEPRRTRDYTLLPNCGQGASI